MKLAFVTELFYPSIGGQEVRFEELGQALISRGHQVRLYTIHFDPSTPIIETRGGIEVVRLATSPRYKTSRFRRNPVDIIRFSIEIMRRRSELSIFDAIIFNIWPVLPQLLLAPSLGHKSIVDICETRSGWFWKFVYRTFTWIPGVRFLGMNPEIIRHMSREHGVAPSKCTVAVSGVDLHAAGSPPFQKDNNQILFFGRLTEHKNPRLLVEAFHESGIAKRGYRLEVAGSGPELEPLRRDLSIPGVTYHGRVSEERKWDLLRSSSLLVMPSRREGFPRVVAEGACVGTPTLSLNFPDNGTCSVVQDYAIGRICAGSRSALVSELQAFAEGKISYSDISNHCLTNGRHHFSWDTVSESLINFLASKDT